ncbi:MAG TPA: TonB-dependent receptor [Sphingomicrobium sp.]|nr:TonB-dependent receptor [Sphingomicrobium sp.]
MRWNSGFPTALLASAALISSSATIAQPAATQTNATIMYDLPAQDLGQILKAIARTSGREILFSSDDVRGLSAPAVHGRYTLDEAIRAALAGSNLVVEYSSGAAIVRMRTSIAPQHHTSPAGDAAITITGSRIRGAGSASPVTVSTRRELEQAGINDLADFTRFLPQNYSGGQNRGIAGGGEQGGQQNLNNSATLNLRGLGPDATLTLLNGHRLSYDTVNQGIDISAIPLGAIDRIEVVSDGASALYGSDAVAGVANIILRPDYEGLEATARVGGSTEGGNTQQEFSLVSGHRWSSGGFMLALDESSATPIFAGQRDYTRTVDPSLTLTDRNRQFSAVLNAHQEFGPGVALEAEGYVMDRRSLLQNPFLQTEDVHVDGLVSRPHVLSFAVTPKLRVDLGRWETSLSVTGAGSRTLLDSDNFSQGVPRHVHLLHDDQLEGAETNAEGPLIALPGGEARLAVGGGARKISLHERFVTLTSPQNITFKNFTESRNVQYAYGELSLPLVSPELNVPLVQRLSVSGALRYEHWNRIAAVTTPKVGVIYQPAQDLTFRATWGKSFKIPTLLQVNEIEEGDLVPGFIFTPPPQPARSTVLLIEGSAPNLRPERATTWSVTAEARPRFIRGFDISATYFDIDYRDRIASPFTSGLTSLFNPLFNDLITYNPSAAQVNALIATLPGGLVNETGGPFDPSNVGAIIDAAIRNTERQRIRGVDLNADYRIELGQAGKLQLTGAASYLNSNQQLAPNQPIFPLAGTVFHPPHWRGHAGAVWGQKPIEVSAFVNYVGSTIDNQFPTMERIGSFTTLDLSTSVQTSAQAGAFRNIELRLSALNVLDQKPHFLRNSFPEAAPFDSTNESPVGRFLGASIRKIW